MKRKNNRVCYISGKLTGAMYLLFFILIAGLNVYSFVCDYPKGVNIFGVIILIILFARFLQWFFYSFESDNKTITIKKLADRTLLIKVR